MTQARIPRTALDLSDLLVDAIYEGGRSGNAGDDPLVPLLGVSNQGGFRHLGKKANPRLLVITTSMNEPDWPDHMDLETGIFTYYGDNRQPGLDLHATRRWGNAMLRDLFARAHSTPHLRHEVPPILIFRRAGTYRDARFMGLAVPGAIGLAPTQDLIATWHHSSGRRFQNYRATFTVLDVPSIPRAWISDIHNCVIESEWAPPAWQRWVKSGSITPLRSIPTVVTRTKREQLPHVSSDRRMLELLRKRFEDRPTDFESCACKIAEMLLPGIVSTDLTRPSRDGGRDATGKYRIGFGTTAIEVEFALEAKCNSIDNSVGVKATSRLISRLRHRQFGILVTTSYIQAQAYQEIVDDSHPIIIVSGLDIVEVLKRAGVRDAAALEQWLAANFGAYIASAE